MTIIEGRDIDYVTPDQFRSEHKRWVLANRNHLEAVDEFETAQRILTEAEEALKIAYDNMASASEGLTHYIIDDVDEQGD